MVLTRTESTQYNTDNSFGEVINKFQNCSTKKIRSLERKKKKTLKQKAFDFI